MKSKLTKIILFAVICILLFGTVSSSAYESYDTFTYSIDGNPLSLPPRTPPTLSPIPLLIWVFSTIRA